MTPNLSVMTPDLRQELQQRKPFGSVEQEAQLSVVRTGSMLIDAFEQMLKPYGITAAQFNVLRILRGAEPEGLCRNELRERLLTRMPDVTRLLDRMVDAGLVERTREGEDRRRVRTRMTPKARRLVDKLDKIVAEEHQRRFGHLGKTRLRELIDTLTEVRQKL
jgi:DNA-binding MarR family transcriptional regulator